MTKHIQQLLYENELCHNNISSGGCQLPEVVWRTALL